MGAARAALLEQKKAYSIKLLYLNQLLNCLWDVNITIHSPPKTTEILYSWLEDGGNVNG